MHHQIDYSLYLIADPSFCKYHSLIEMVAAAIAGGVTCVQLRNKIDSKDVILQQAAQLKKLLSEQNIPLIINDHVEIAKTVNAAGVHLGESDGSVEQARALLGPNKIIGLSMGSPEKFSDVESGLVNYFGVGPVYATQSKDCSVDPWGLEKLAYAVTVSPLPLVGIGGINQQNIASVMLTGIAGAAVLSAICSASDPQTEARLLKEKIPCIAIQ